MALDFELISEFTPIHRRGFDIGTVDGAGTNITNPNATNPLVLGEFLELNTSYQMIRGTGAAAVPSYGVFSERGRTDTQSLKKATMLYMGAYEAQTKVMDATSLVVGSLLMVGDVTYGGLTRRGLLLRTSTNYVVGVVTRLPANNNGYLRFMRVGG